jgi:cell division septum initiation protein DivIVA
VQPAAEEADSNAARRAARKAAQEDARWKKQARLERKANKKLQKVQARHHPASDSDDECGGVEPAGEAYIIL